jgi:hypothetical protein
VYGVALRAVEDRPDKRKKARRAGGDIFHVNGGRFAQLKDRSNDLEAGLGLQVDASTHDHRIDARALEGRANIVDARAAE